MIRALAMAAVMAAASPALSACARDQAEQAQFDAAPTADQARAWLAENGKKPGVVTTPSGLQYQIIRSGPATGIKPAASDTVKVHYEGTLTDGTKFDSSYDSGQPLIARPENLVPGWTEALQLMRPGDEWRLFVPPELGYGADGAGPIPPNSVLVFRLEMLDVLGRAPTPAG